MASSPGRSQRTAPRCRPLSSFRSAPGAPATASTISGPAWRAAPSVAAHHKDPLAARGISDALAGAQLLADHVLRGWDHDLGQALYLYAAELTRMLQPTADINDQLAGLNLPAEQADRTWQELQAAERQSYPATLAARSA